MIKIEIKSPEEAQTLLNILQDANMAKGLINAEACVYFKKILDAAVAESQKSKPQE